MPSGSRHYPAPASYQALRERLERRETIAAVRQGLEDVAAGRIRPAREVLDE